MSKKVVVGLEGIILLLVTGMLYGLCMKDLFEVPIKWISLIFVLTSEIILLVKGFKIESGIISYTRLITGLIALVIVILTTLLFIIALSDYVNLFIGLNVFCLASEAVVDVLLGYFAKKEKAKM